MTLDAVSRSDGRIDVLLTPADLRAEMAVDVRAGLTAIPKHLPPKYFYDDRGSRLFEQITELPEYYQTRTERRILIDHADEIAAAADAEALLELGSGSSSKTRTLLEALDRRRPLTAYLPVDVSVGALSEAMDALGREYPGLPLHGFVADFDRHLDRLPSPGRRLIAFLGGTIGNHPPPRRRHFFAALSATMAPGESLLLGVDLVKDPARLVAAYDDAAGVTAAFNRNVIDVVSREFDGDLDPADFEHVAVWDPDREWIEMRLRARRPVAARLADLDLTVSFAAGEEMRTEISAKFRRPSLERELVAAGLAPRGWWTDADGDFALVLATA
ncbi:L-histidine N(alpha)-methyltransferase [Gordonia aichiensis]|uniref:L-histidine N(alpha)-methyltransferase n=1 Tax=Gordonia aichiensis TaxID=36820 RepID=UPI0032638406